MYVTTFSRIYLSYILFNVAGWVFFAYLTYYTKNLTTQTCNSYTKELTDSIKIIVGISMSMITINIFSATEYIFTQTNGITLDNYCCIFTTIVIILSIAGINSLVTFCITSGMTKLQCSNNEAEFGIKLAVYGVIWIAFVEMFLIFFAIMRFLYYIILDAKLHEFCAPCFDIWKKYRERRIAVEPTIPKYSTDCVSIPISALKQEPKMLCSVCYDGSITLLLEPCNHICICEQCYNSLIAKECPVCKTGILMTKKVFFVSPNPV
jgi:hypothetical protein